MLIKSLSFEAAICLERESQCSYLSLCHSTQSGWIWSGQQRGSCLSVTHPPSCHGCPTGLCNPAPYQEPCLAQRVRVSTARRWPGIPGSPQEMIKFRLPLDCSHGLLGGLSGARHFLLQSLLGNTSIMNSPKAALSHISVSLSTALNLQGGFPLPSSYVHSSTQRPVPFTICLQLTLPASPQGSGCFLIWVTLPGSTCGNPALSLKPFPS